MSCDAPLRCTSGLLDGRLKSLVAVITLDLTGGQCSAFTSVAFSVYAEEKEDGAGVCGLPSVSANVIRVFIVCATRWS